MAFYGRRVTAGDTDYGEISQNQQRTSVYNKTTENGWGHTLGFWGGRTSGFGNPTVKVGVWTTSNLTPATRMAYHNGVVVSTLQTAGTNGQAYTVPVQNVNNALSPGSNAIKMYANVNYAIGLLPTGTMMSHAMVQAAYINGENEQFYHKDGITTPADPNGYTYSSNEGWISAWIEYEPNRAPSGAASSPSGFITTTTPTFSGSFSDPDSGYGDRITKLRILVQRVSDGVVMWDTGNTSTNATEQANFSFSRAYGGSALAAGVEYQWQIAVADSFDTWSAWSAISYFTVNGGGIIASPNTPTGKQNSLQPTPFTATWSHASALAMNAVEVRIKQGAAIIKTSGTVAKSVADGGAISATWTELFSTYALTWGVNYSWEMRGRDTGNLWSNWSSERTFATNNPPDVPYNLTPTNSTPSSSRPLLTATATDADGDNVTVKARIKNSDGTVLQTRTMTKSGNTFTYQTTSTDLPSTATYKWDAYSYDGSLYSGAQTVEANATKSAEASFIYGSGPVVTITAPTGTITTSTPVITWTTTDQQKYQVVLTQSGSVVYDTGIVTSAQQSHTIPSGIVRHGMSYSVTVTVTNSAPLSGSSPASTFTVSYTLPSSITGLHASAEYQQFDAKPSSIRLTWDASTDPAFIEYLVSRSDGVDEVVLARIPSQSQVVFIDYHPESGVEYTYSVVQVTLQGIDTLVSAPTTTTGRVELAHVVLASVTNGAASRAGLRLDSDRSFDHHDDLVLEHAWGDSAPSAAYGTAQYQSFSGQFTLATDELANARDHMEALRSLWRSRATLSYRDERGRRFFCKISKFSEDDKRVQFYTVSLTLTEVNYREGVI